MKAVGTLITLAADLCRVPQLKRPATLLRIAGLVAGAETALQGEETQWNDL